MAAGGPRECHSPSCHHSWLEVFSTGRTRGPYWHNTACTMWSVSLGVVYLDSWRSLISWSWVRDVGSAKVRLVLTDVGRQQSKVTGTNCAAWPHQPPPLTPLTLWTSNNQSKTYYTNSPNKGTSESLWIWEASSLSGLPGCLGSWQSSDEVCSVKTVLGLTAS